MTPKPLRSTEEEDVPESARINDDDAGDETDSGMAKISFFWKLMLCAQLLGLEASCDFEQLYTVPLLQTLGMPLSLISLTGLGEGLIAMPFLPLIGWLTDRGSNDQRRKTIANFFGAGLQVIGMLSVITANVMHLTNLANFNSRNATKIPQEGFDGLPGSGTTLWILSTVSAVYSSQATSSVSLKPSPWADTTLSHTNIHDEVLDQSPGGKLSKLIHVIVFTFIGVFDDPVTFVDTVFIGIKPAISKVPFKADLAMFGFIVLSLGFDMTNSVVRSFLLACTPRAEHTSLLVIGLIMASTGGLSTASMGIVDFPKLLGLSSLFEGGSLVIQTSLQGVFISTCVLLGLLITTLSGRKHRKLTVQCRALPDNRGDEDVTSALPHHEQLTVSSRFESSVSSFVGGGGVNFEPTLSLLSQSEDFMPQKWRASSNSELAPLLSRENDEEFRDSGEFVQSYASSMSLSYGSKDSTYLCSGQQQQQQTVAEAPLEVVPENAELKVERSDAVTSNQCCKIGFKAKFTFLVLMAFFGTGPITMFTMTGSDFVAKAIYGGDPEAPPCSDSAARYQDGMRAASRGFVVYYGTYLCISFVHPRILAKLGCRVEYVAIHFLVGVAMLITSFTQRLEAFYFLAVVSGFHRACVYVVPFSITNDLIRARARSTGGKTNLGLAISLVTVMMPLEYCVIFPMVGPLEVYLNNTAVSLWIGAVCCCLASTFIILLGKV